MLQSTLQIAVPDLDINCSRRARSFLPLTTVAFLREWIMSPEHIYNPYPTEVEKQQIIEATGIQMKQLTNWFTNNRKRFWKPKMSRLMTSQKDTADPACRQFDGAEILASQQLFHSEPAPNHLPLPSSVSHASQPMLSAFAAAALQPSSAGTCHQWGNLDSSWAASVSAHIAHVQHMSLAAESHCAGGGDDSDSDRSMDRSRSSSMCEPPQAPPPPPPPPPPPASAPTPTAPSSPLSVMDSLEVLAAVASVVNSATDEWAWRNKRAKHE